MCPHYLNRQYKNAGRWYKDSTGLRTSVCSACQERSERVLAGEPKTEPPVSIKQSEEDKQRAKVYKRVIDWLFSRK